MPRKKSKGNGQGSVYPRRNKDGKVTHSVRTTALMGSGTVSAKSKTEVEKAKGSNGGCG